jgi:CheY-like chemotaxis protein
MEVRSLVVCPNAETLAVLAEGLHKVEVTAIACESDLAALDLLWQERFDAVIVDCDALPSGMELVKVVRLASGRTSVLLALVAGEASLKQAFEHGANLVLEKPLTAQTVARTLHAARSLMVADQRRYFRLPIEIDVHLHSEAGQTLDVSVKTTDLSAGGMALRVPRPIEPRRMLEVSFKPAGMETRVHAEAEVSWSDARGTCGVRFVHIPLEERWAFEKWLTAELQKRAIGAVEATSQSAK